LSYGYTQGQKNNGNITNITDNVDNGRSVSYTYDALNRLTSAVTAGDTNYPQWGLSETYDQYGNKYKQTIIAGCTAITCPQYSHMDNPGTNQFTDAGLSYDANGNMTDDGYNAMTYDAANRMVGLSNSVASNDAYVYDGNGDRVEKTSGGTTTVYIWSGDKVIAEYALGASPSSPSEEYAYSEGELISTIDSITKYHLHDHLSIRMTTDVDGNPLGWQGEFPFGESWYDTNTVSKWMFTGKERDADSGLDNFLARYNSSNLGRFMQPDPATFSAIDTSPQTWNMYSYVANNPINAIDPDGLDCVYATQMSGGVAVSVASGSCKAGDGGTYVNGKVDMKSLTYDGSNLGYNYSPGNGEGGVGVIALGAAPDSGGNSFDNNQFAIGVFSQLNQMPMMKMVGAAAALGLTGGAVCYLVCPEAAGLTTLGLDAGAAGVEEAGGAAAGGRMELV
jgi:RHS repeat-associated protein